MADTDYPILKPKLPANDGFWPSTAAEYAAS